MNRVESYYDENAHLEWDRFDRHPVEFAMTKRALAENLPPVPARVLDCGGGPGRYAIHLAGQGYPVTLLDLSTGNLALAREKAQEAGVSIADFIHGNALDLSRFQDASFDVVLLMGPLYHLVRPEDREQAIREALRVLKPGGVLFAAFITLYASIRDPLVKCYAQNYADDPSIVEGLLQTHQNGGSNFTEAWFAHPDEARALMAVRSLRELAFLATEALATGRDAYLKTLDAAAFEYWMDLNYRLARDPYLFGASDHLLYVGKKLLV